MCTNEGHRGGQESKAEARCRLAGPSITVLSEAPSLHYKRDLIFAVKCDLSAEADRRASRAGVPLVLCSTSIVYLRRSYAQGGTGTRFHHEMVPLINDYGDSDAGSIKDSENTRVPVQ